MRGTPDGLSSPYPIIGLMPAVYQEDMFATRWTEGFDAVLAPIIATLDCLDSYFDPLTAPEDFVDWMANWFGLALNPTWPLGQRRAAVGHATEFFRMRGTVQGLREQLAIVFGAQVKIIDNGGVAWSVSPDADLPGEDTPRLAVRVTFTGEIDTTAVDEVVAAAKPAHVVHRVEVVKR
ncbi:phage tail protein [Lentzea sp. NEAU-D7]|uniref:phage tail protein n=1 Tax=Lentzea sp. NEAU-D7 TaxID=2994667 RepID=UPI00224AB680|nr:phage tail protein [Lentzea sp. NEAU-D7]MCX2954573.1 phage tail protein [Lentzea sp. NEAU-D7]